MTDILRGEPKKVTIYQIILTISPDKDIIY